MSANKTFPIEGILPKEEIQASQFIANNADCDGRGVVVAIFDTGVDPAAEGMQTTPQGAPKVIDIVDATGGDDVDTSRTVKAEGGADADIVISGATGRKLKLGKRKNPTGTWHIGLRRAYEFFPGSLVTRLKTERKEDAEKAHQRLLDALDAQLHAPNVGADARADIEERIKTAAAMWKDYEDPGPIYDCVVFHDGECWRAIIDTSECGECAALPALTDYVKERQYGTFSERDLLSFSVNIYDEGNTLSLVTTVGAHGTHVAGIVGAYYPQQPELNGIAPGCQIVSIKIGDCRLGSMETGAGLVRGVLAAKRAGVDLINMSYGEAVTRCNVGRFTEIARELVVEHGVIFVSSAGNSGPALSTVGAPGSTVTELIGVGAYVSPAMMKAEYSLLSPLSETQYTWSSRGPTYDGHAGVSISAPGGAISTVPTYTLTKNMLMNGTSMASPSACGGIALMLSKLKRDGVPYSPFIVRRAVEESARHVANVERLAQGRGLLQVAAAYQWIVDHNDWSDTVRFNVRVPSRRARGIYLREAHESGEARNIGVAVHAAFAKRAANAPKVAFERRIRLVSTAPWVSVPSHLFVSSDEREFLVRVDPTSLRGGALHHAEVVGIDEARAEAGALFRVPVVVVRPQAVSGTTPTLRWRGIVFESAHIERRFVTVPTTATWAQLKVSADASMSGSRRFFAHCVQLVPHSAFSSTQAKHYFEVHPAETRTFKWDVVGGLTLEVCVAQYWSSLGAAAALDLELDFFGVETRPSTAVHFNVAERLTRVEVHNHLRLETLSPAAKLTHVRKVLAPMARGVVQCARTPIDEQFDGAMNVRMKLEYTLQLERNADVTLSTPVLHRLLYENEFDSQFLTVRDSTGFVVAVGDFRPEPMKLKSGKHSVELVLAHGRRDRLEALAEWPLLVDVKLEKEMTASVYASELSAQRDSAKFGTKKLLAGAQCNLYVAAPSAAACTKAGVSVGDELVGRLTLYKEDDKRGELSLRCTFGNAMKVGKATAAAAGAESGATASSESSGDMEKAAAEVSDKLDEVDEAVLSALVGVLKKHVKSASSVKSDAEASKAVDRFAAVLKRATAVAPKRTDAYAEHVAFLSALCDACTKRSLTERSSLLAAETVAAADALAELIDVSKMAEFYGRRTGDSADEKAAAKRWDSLKAQLIAALQYKYLALAHAHLQHEDGGVWKVDVGVGSATSESSMNASQRKELNDVYGQLSHWVKWTDKKDGSALTRVYILHQWLEGKFGATLKLLNTMLTRGSKVQEESKETRANVWKMRDVLLARLGGEWKVHADNVNDWSVLRNN